MAYGAAMRARARANIRPYSRSRNCYRSAPRGLGLFPVSAVNESLSFCLFLMRETSGQSTTSSNSPLGELANHAACRRLSLARPRFVRVAVSVEITASRCREGNDHSRRSRPREEFSETRTRRNRSFKASLSFPHLPLSLRRRIFVVTLRARARAISLPPVLGRHRTARAKFTDRNWRRPARKGKKERKETKETSFLSRKPSVTFPFAE